MSSGAGRRLIHMTDRIDLGPAARRMATLVEGVPDDALEGPTPCTRYRVGDLLDHIGGLAVAFAASARKTPLGSGPSGDAARLAPDWRVRIPADLAAMADAWSDPGAWEGITAAGGVDLPGGVAGLVALDELVVHGWDLARATGQPDGYDGPGLEAMHGVVQQLRGADGVFGPEVTVGDDAPLFERILGLAGRDPSWVPA
jgi:uncharacterized protein (TIGR03086 family)